jgi:hypothetical protein
MRVDVRQQLPKVRFSTAASPQRFERLDNFLTRAQLKEYCKG